MSNGVVYYNAEQITHVGVYFAAYGGADFAQDYGNGKIVETGYGADYPYKGHDGSSIGGVGGLKAGYDFMTIPIGGGMALEPAVELDAFYLGTSPKVKSSYFPGDNFTIQGSLNNGVLTANGILRLKTGTLVTPYLGVGVGGEYLSFSHPYSVETGSFGTAVETLGHDSSALCFAAQGLAGLDVALTRQWALFYEYKYVAAFAPSFDLGSYTFTGGNGPYEFRFKPDFIGQQAVVLGVRYSF